MGIHNLEDTLKQEKRTGNYVVYMTGMHGSGTSLTSNFLGSCGLDMLGENIVADPLGEHKKFRLLSHRILRDSNVHRYTTDFNRKSIRPLKSTVSLMRERIKEALLFGKGKFGFKAPINSLAIWSWVPLLQQFVDVVVVVHIFRNPVEVIDSFLRRKSKKDKQFISSNGNPKVVLEKLWVNYNKSVLDFEKLSVGNHKFVYLDIDDLFDRPNFLPSILRLKYHPLESLVNPKKLLRADGVSFQLKGSEAIWSSLVGKR